MLGHGAIVDGKKYMRLDAHKLMLEGAAEREETLRAENQRLREALAELVAEQDARDVPQGSSGYPDTGGLILARAALGDK
jgi:regulator of replication initiation timing